MSDPLHLDMINIITKFHLYRVNREGIVMKFAHVKTDKIILKFEFLQKVKSHYLANQ
jgi:hypothetical protein